MLLQDLINNKDYEGLKRALSDQPGLANMGISYDEMNASLAHPLHRLCDAVFAKRYTDDEALAMAKIFIEHGARINGLETEEKKDTPLTAACSLGADALALYYLREGADIHLAGCHGGTALHWASWCGRDAVVSRLIEAGADINRRCIDFRATPLFWAVHGLKTGGLRNLHHQVNCIKILLDAGADKAIPNAEGRTAYDLLGTEDDELKALLR